MVTYVFYPDKIVCQPVVCFDFGKRYDQFDHYHSLSKADRKVFLKNILRATLIDILSVNDRNGIYSDSDSLAEFGYIATKQELIECFKRVIADNY